MREGDRVVRIPLDRVEPGPHQPRRHFAEAELAELADSIRGHGVIQPVIVRPVGRRRYQLIAGERRWRAAAMVGLDEIPAIVRNMSEEDAALVAVIENVQREDLHFLEEAEAYQRLLGQFGLTQLGLANRLGRSQATIANKLRLLRLPAEVRLVISREIVNERHARALLQLPSSDQQLEVLHRIREENLTVRETERLVARILDGGQVSRRRSKVKGVVRDIRIFLNAFRQAASALREAGIQADVKEEDHGDYFEFRVRIPKLVNEGSRERKAARNSEDCSV